MVGVDGHLEVAEEDLQARAALQRVVQRLGQRALRQQLGAMALRAAPSPEGLDYGPDMGLAIGALVVAGRGAGRR